MAALLFGTAPAPAAMVDVMQIGIWDGSYWFTQGMSGGAMALNLPDNSCVGYLAAGAASYSLITSYQLTAAALTADLSSGGIAQGVFADNQSGNPSTLTITGSIVEAGFTGTLLVAKASGAASSIETSSLGGTRIDVHQNFMVTGGELATGAVTGLKAWPLFTAIYTFDKCSADATPGQVQDFQSSIQYSLGDTNVHLQFVPEPVTLALLGLGGLLGLRRR